jgi:hypothetical protein
MVFFQCIQGVQVLGFLFVIVGQNVGYHNLSDFEITAHSLANLFFVLI